MMSIDNNKTEKKQEVRWLALESNPDIMNDIIHKNGIADEWNFIDIYGFDDESVSLIPRPTAAFIFLFPDTKNYNEFRDKEVKYLKLHEQNISEKVKFFKQTIRNACGMMALIHCLANNQQLLDDGLFKKIMIDTNHMSPEERAEYLETCQELAIVHENSAKSGQSETPHLQARVTNHFISFVNVDDHIYELDGSRTFPINHGKCTDFVNDTIKIMKTFIDRDPNEYEYSAIALSNTK